MNPKASQLIARLTKARERRERMIRKLKDIDRGSEYGWELIGDTPVTGESLFDIWAPNGSIIRSANKLAALTEAALDNSHSPDDFHEKLVALLSREIAEGMRNMDEMVEGEVYRLSAPRM